MHARRLVFLSTLLVAMPAEAADFEPWPSLFVSAPVGGGWQVSGEVIGRFTARDDRPDQGEYRLQAGRQIGPGLVLWAGFVHFDNYLDGHVSGRENQAVEQLNWAGLRAGPIRFAFRTRLEQRFISGAETVSWRFRQQVRATVPAGPVAFVAWVEPFVTLNRTPAARTRLDRLRYFAGISIPLGRHVDLETGLLRQELHRPQGNIATDALPLIVNVRM